MILQIYAVKDSATDQFGSPMFLMAAGQATRSFVDQVNKQEQDNPLYMHPDDYSLYHLGEFDTNAGTFNAKAPELVIRGKDAKVKQS